MQLQAAAVSVHSHWDNQHLDVEGGSSDRRPESQQPESHDQVAEVSRTSCCSAGCQSAHHYSDVVSEDR